ncbi:MAG: hypothetical protein AB4372_07850 [Xenococcus sp. (in: cyanobacteria)]
MKIESIEQELIEGTKIILTRVTLNQVNSPCLLSRLMIDSLGKPGIDNDLELLGSGSQWEVVWTQPRLTIEQTRKLISQAITPSP